MMSKPRRTRESGQGLVEFALAFPIVFIFIIAIIEFAFAFNSYQSVVYAARAGARAGAIYLYQNDCSKDENDDNRKTGVSACTEAYTDNIEATVRRALAGMRTSATISVGYIEAAIPRDNRSGDVVNVQIDYTHNFITPLLHATSFSFTGTASQVIER